MTASQAVLNAVNGCPTITHEQGGGIFGDLAKPIASVLAAFYHVVPSYGVAILGLSLVWMLIISPLTLKSTRSMLAMQKLQPQLKKLQEQHRNDRQAFAQAQMELFREQGVSPFGSCLPTILPLPVFFALFRVIDGLSHKTTVHLSGGGTIKCPNPHYLAPHTQMFKDIVAGNGSLHSFGMDLAKNALSSHSSFASALPFWALLLIMIGTQYLQTVQMMSRNPAAQDNPQMKMMKYIPIVFGVICIRFPAGVVLYYSMSNICRIAQQTAMYRFDPKVRALAARDVIEVEAHTAEIDESNRKGKGGGGTSLAKKPADAPKPKPKSRFQAMLEQANEREAERKAAKASAKGPQDAPSKGGATKGSNGSSTKGGGAKSGANPSARNGGAAKNGGTKPGGTAKSGNGASTRSGKSGSGNGNGNGNGAKNGNAGNGANGRSRASEPPPIKTNRARTGARSGGGKKRRGR